MEKEIKDMLIAIQGSIIKLQEGQEELRKGQEELKQGQEELKQGQEELRQDVNELQEDVKDLQVRQDKYEMSQREIVYDILIPIRDNQNYINQEVRAELERIKAIIA